MKILLGVFLAALALFVWGFLFWATPLTHSVYSEIPDEEAFAQSLRDQLPGSGVYVLPDLLSEEQDRTDLARKVAAHRAGPLATVFVRMKGAEPMNPLVFVMGFVHMLLAVVIMLLLLRMALPALGGYGARVGFVFLAGIFAAFWINLSMPIWWYHPWNFYLTAFVYNAVAWLWVGLILGWFVRPAAVRA